MKGISSIFLFLYYFFTPVVSLKYSQLQECPVSAYDTFPNDFVIGAASSAYQVEGAWNEDGKGPSIWDTATHKEPNKISDLSNADVAADSYHKYMQDVKALNDTGFQSYRFSISWPRIMPTGEPSSLNRAGINYYHRLIDNLIANNIVPVVTMYHWDLPQAVQDLGGFLSPVIADLFEDYANVLFREFGDKVKHWSTFNEPLMICEMGYEKGTFAPFINAAQNGGYYYCAYHLLVAHARAYRLYDSMYRDTQQGTVGIVMNFEYLYALDTQDSLNAERGMQYKFGIFANPIFAGGWPEVVQKEVMENSRIEGRVWPRLPSLDTETMAYIQGSADWLGLNYYSSYLVKRDGGSQKKVGLEKDLDLVMSKDPKWAVGLPDSTYNVPEGFRDAMNFVAKSYNNPEIWITENGWPDSEPENDVVRVRFYIDHMREILKAIKCDGVNVKQYYAWSIIDNFEWISGYTQKFGLFNVDFTDPERPRTPKTSARLFSEILRTRSIPDTFL